MSKTVQNSLLLPYLLLSILSFFTTIGIQSSDGGKPVYHNRKNMSTSDRHLMTAFGSLRQMCDRLNLTNAILNTAKRIYKQVAH